jgi:hypothetical protein
MPRGPSHEIHLFRWGFFLGESQTGCPRSFINNDRRHLFRFKPDRFASFGEGLIPGDIKMAALETVDFFPKHSHSGFRQQSRRGIQLGVSF